MTGLHKQAVARAFGKAAGYDAQATIQSTVAGRLAARIAGLPLPPAARILEIGCGTGFLTEALRAALPDARWIVSDLSPEMVARCRRKLRGRPALGFLVMDGERPCFDAKAGFDLICSSLAMQWFEDLPGAIGRLVPLLAPGGHLAFTTLAQGTFAEWRTAHDALGETAATPDYPDADALRALGCQEVEMYDIVEQHADARAFLAALRAIGAGTPAAGRAPLAAGALRGVMRRFEAEGSVARYRIASCVLTRGPA